MRIELTRKQIKILQSICVGIIMTALGLGIIIGITTTIGKLIFAWILLISFIIGVIV